MMNLKKMFIAAIIVGVLIGLVQAFTAVYYPSRNTDMLDRSHRAAEWQRSHPEEYRQMRDAVENHAFSEEGE